jgi:hypothetical protein
MGDENVDVLSMQQRHEHGPAVTPESADAVAALAGVVSSGLTELDSRNVGGRSIHANSLDKKQLARELTAVKRQGQQHVQQQPITQQPQVYPQQVPAQPPVQHVHQPVATPIPKSSAVVDKKELTAIRRRLKKIEDEHKTLKSIIEFKPIYKKYTVKTDTFEGEANNVTYLLDIIVKELAKKPSEVIIKAK